MEDLDRFRLLFYMTALGRNIVRPRLARYTVEHTGTTGDARYRVLDKQRRVIAEGCLERVMDVFDAHLKQQGIDQPSDNRLRLWGELRIREGRDSSL